MAKDAADINALRRFYGSMRTGALCDFVEGIILGRFKKETGDECEKWPLS